MAGWLRDRQNIRAISTPAYAALEFASAVVVVLMLYRLLVEGETAVWAAVDVALIAVVLWRSIYFRLVRSGRWPTDEPTSN